MKTGVLLKKLIFASKMTKTGFAIAMNMTPSGLSKILTGKRLPSAREGTMFCNQAAHCLAEALYGQECYLTLQDIFPLLYDFHSSFELEEFLFYAVKYALDCDLTPENGIDAAHPDHAASFLGYKMILNMLCIIISDHVTSEGADILEFYSALPVLNRSYTGIFRRMKISRVSNARKIVFHHFWNRANFEAAYAAVSSKTLLHLSNVERHVDFILWRMPNDEEDAFLLLKGAFLLNFNVQMDGVPQMTFIRHRGFVASFLNYLLKSNARKITYHKDEAIAALEANPSFLSKLSAGGLKAVYNFIYIGYLAQKEELTHLDCPDRVKTNLLRFLQSILTGDVKFYITYETLRSFYGTGHTILPLIGTADVPADQRVSYLKRFGAYVCESSSDRIKAVNNVFPKVLVICAKGLSLVYFPGADGQPEKVHYLETYALEEILAKEMENTGPKISDFSPELWDSFLREVERAVSQRPFQ